MTRARQICLSGYMGTGKSTVGPILAARLGRPFIDLDDAIEAAAGQAIPAIFAAVGEAGFRARERAVLSEVLAGPGAVIAVIALGGGAVVDPVNRAAVRGAGILITLTAEPETLLARLGHGEGRPLAQGDPLARLAQRQAAYADCDLVFPTDDGTPAELAERLVEVLG